jgi:putative DNA primase/helicase
LARSHPAVAVHPDEFDIDPWAVNTPEGLIDLRTGLLRPVKRGEYLTKSTLVAAREMPTPIFDRFLLDIMGAQIPPQLCACAACCSQSDGASPAQWLTDHLAEVNCLQLYLRRLYGYALSGDTAAHMLAVQHGLGGNGKGLLNDLICLDIMGMTPSGYSNVIPIEALLSPKGERHPTELMGLFGARLALARESDEATRWNEGRVKALSGGDPITARSMRQDFITFKATHKLIVFSNARPTLSGGTQAAWHRRLHMINFPQRL